MKFASAVFCFVISILVSLSLFLDSIQSAFYN
ncbi:uncharacterized protein Dvir_GJ27123 [Drosophila virilis]|uniref:Uncharacterized protein n=1 Tax=Drosophila virilis TaxID=7244 RepID=A0A0Q9WGM2_DROVI|nr:uncharacterized protein Dvir_GJ27123 [Drosophila virilis]